MKTDMSSEEFRKLDPRRKSPAQKAWETQQGRALSEAEIIENRKRTRGERYARSMRRQMDGTLRTLEVYASSYQELTGCDHLEQARTNVAAAFVELTRVIEQERK